MARIQQNTGNPDKGAWDGYTIEELKFLRATALIRLQFQKERLAQQAGATLPSGKGLGFGLADKMSFASKVILFIKGLKLANNLFSLFRTSKKK